MSVPFSKLDKFKMETVFHDGYVVNTTIGWDLSTTKAVLTTWTRQKKLGSGGFGTVWLEKNEEGGQLRAVKKLQRVDVAQMAFTNELVALITLADVSDPCITFDSVINSAINCLIKLLTELKHIA